MLFDDKKIDNENECVEGSELAENQTKREKMKF
jgi:hypothetical protein